ncbi:TreTu family toxin [Streptosporangium sp. LJ11]|uniref:TreTu family toxin n=1 Tax=Streptosporangium sp. LJ11 TaxID=3436927 RepID=UPI003F7A9D3A
MTSTFTYGGAGRLLTQTAPGVKNEVTNVTHTAKATYTYNADGDPLTETVADLTGGDAARTTSYTYDAQGRVETVTDPEGGMTRSTWDNTGARVSLTDQLGTVFTYGYTKRGELASTTIKNWTGSPLAPKPAQDVVLEARSYDDGGRLGGRADAMGRKTRYTYFADNRLSEVIGDDVRLNESTTATDVVLQANTYDAAGNITKETFTGAGSARTESTTYTYNALGLVDRQTVENGADDLVTTRTYDDRGLLTATTDPRGNASGATAADFTTTMRYDLAGRLVEAKAPQVTIEKNATASAGRPAVRYGYNSAGLATHAVDGEGRTLTSAFDKAGRLTSTTSPSYTPPGGAALIPKISYEYDAAGQLTSVTDERTYVTSTTYDALGRAVKVTDPGPSGPGGAWTAEYDLRGEQLAAVDPTGARTEATYDDLGRQITATQIERTPTTAAYTTKLTYDTADNLTKTVAPGPGSTTKTTNYVVNAAGQPTSITDPLTHASTFSYDILGRTVRVTDPLKNATEAEYDLAGRQIAAKDLTKINTVDTVVRTFGFGYDLAGNATSTTSGEGRITRRTFDAAHRMTSLVEPVAAGTSITSTFGYDATGARTRTTDGRGNATWTTYNSLGLVESVIEPATSAHPNAADRTWTSLYDAAGNTTATLQPGGVRIDRTFDHLGRLTTQTGSGASVATPERNFTYDSADRVTAVGDYSLEYNDRSLLTKVSKATNQVATYAYDASGNPTQRVDPTGTAAYTWDVADRLKTATDPVTGRTWTYGYDDADRLTSKTSASPVNTQTYGYDALNRPASQTVKNSSGVELAKIVYGWDKDDNLTSKTTTGTAGAGANTYGYDHAGRLTSWTAPGGATTAYTWDDSGNRTGAGSDTFVYDQRNRLISGAGTDYTYTPRGTTATETKAGTTRALAFDAFDRLISDGEASYGYDALGRVTSRTKGADQRRFVYSGLSNDIATIADGANTTLARYGRAPSGGLLSLQEGAGPALATMSDQHGDLVATFSATAPVDSVAYDPFGKPTHHAGTQRTLGYQGEYTDPDTGKVNMHARWYQPGTGAFVSRDTPTLHPDPSIKANRYTYANASPLVYDDPSGQDPPDIHCDDDWDAQDAANAAKSLARVPGPVGTATGCWESGGSGNSGGSGGNNGKNNGKNGGKPDSPNSGKNKPPNNNNGNNNPPPNPPQPPNNDKDKNQKGTKPPPKRAPEPKPQLPKKDIYEKLGFPKDRGPTTIVINTVDSGGGGGGGTDWNNPPDSGPGRNTEPVDYTPPISTTPPPPVEPPLPPSIPDGDFWDWLDGLISGINDATTLYDPCWDHPPCNRPHFGDTGTEAFQDGYGDGQEFITKEPCSGLEGMAFDVCWFTNQLASGAVKGGGPRVPRVGKAGKGLPSNPCKGGSSFIAGTLVMMADGTQKPIEDVEVGEYVLATDPETGRTEARAVTILISSEGTKDLVKLTVDIDRGRGDATAAITATDKHPFWVPSLREWIDAGELQPGMWLQTSAGTHVQIAAIKKWTTARHVHNLTVDDIHTYYVVAGDQAILVHNTRGGDPDDDMARVGRWMSPAEYEAMMKTGMVQSGAGDRSYVVHPPSKDAYKPTWPGSVYVEFDVPRSTLVPGGRPGDYKMAGPNSFDARVAARKGLPIPNLPPAKNITLGGSPC